MAHYALRRDGLWKKAENRDPRRGEESGDEHVRMCENCHDAAIEGEMLRHADILQGAAQGRAPSPTLFKTFLRS